jgi:glycosyltransferase involved in cell wall biosynthesis
MKITVVIATLNVGSCLQGCLDSYRMQTWQMKELIIVDGGSTDDTVEIIRRNEEYISFWLSERDGGIYDAWNKALKHATGTWVLFRGADDRFWADNTLERAVEGLRKAAPNELVCYGSIACVDDEQRIVGLIGAPWNESKDRFLREMCIPHAGAFHHIELFRQFGEFDTTYRIAGDYDFLLRVLVDRNVAGKFLPGIVVTRMHGGGVSHRHGVLTKMESIAALRRNGVSRMPVAQYREMLKLFMIAWRWKLVSLILGKQKANQYRDRRHNRMSQRLSAKILEIENTHAPR